MAGGDGTVAKVARRLVKSHSKIPMSVLPLGTANNVARALGFDISAEAVIAGLKKGKAGSFDVGFARGPWGKRYFFEGAGAGLFADYLSAPQKEKAKTTKSKAQELKQHLTELRRLLRNYPAREWQIELDGQDFSGRYLLWQAMNIASVGPVLELAPDARSDDGKFDFVGVRETDRVALLNYLQARIAGKKPKPPLLVRRFKQMRARSKQARLHFDDEPWPKNGKRKAKRSEIELTVCDSALQIWKTQPAQRKTKKRKKNVPKSPAVMTSSPVSTKPRAGDYSLRQETTPDEPTTLRTLDKLLQMDAVRAHVWAIVQRVRADLSGKPGAVMTWEPIPLEVFENLPAEIKSSWVFVLRAGTNTGPERHPNSHQRMMSFAGGGDLQTGELDVWKSNALTSDPSAPWEQRWVSIPPNVWHQPIVPNESDWVVVSFHTVPAEELVEERPDETQGATRQMKYLAGTKRRARGSIMTGSGPNPTISIGARISRARRRASSSSGPSVKLGACETLLQILPNERLRDSHCASHCVTWTRLVQK